MISSARPYLALLNLKSYSDFWRRPTDDSSRKILARGSILLTKRDEVALSSFTIKKCTPT